MPTAMENAAEHGSVSRKDTLSENKLLGRVGLIGLGNVGMHYADHLLKASREVVVFDKDDSKTSRAIDKGARKATSSRELAEECDTIVLALPSPPAVENEMLGTDGILNAARKGSLIIDISTIDPDTSKSLYKMAKDCGFYYLEAPMSGGEPGGAGQRGAKSGTITFMVGGDEESFERARPILNVLGSHAFFLGPAGTGNTVKLVSNLIAGLNMAAMAEGFVLGAAAGISHEKLLEVFRHTDAKSYTMFEEFAPDLCANDYEGGFPVDLMHKDHRLAGELGRKLGVPLLFNQLAQEVYQIVKAKGYGRLSHAVVVEVLASIADVELFNKKRRDEKSRCE